MRTPSMLTRLAGLILALPLAVLGALETTASGSVSWSTVSTWAPSTQIPCVADAVVVSGTSTVTIAGRARAQSIVLDDGAEIVLDDGASIELPQAGMPEPYWCSAATPYPVTAPTAQAAAPAVVAINATLNVPLTAVSIRSAIAAHFTDANGLPLVYSLAWSNTSATDAGAASWLQYTDATGNVTGTPTDWQLALTETVFVASANNSVHVAAASPEQFSVVVTVGKRPPAVGNLVSPQTVPWQLPWNTDPATEANVLRECNLTGLFSDPDGFPLTYTVNISSPAPSWHVDPVALVPMGTPNAFGTWSVTVVATNNVSQSSPAFTFSVMVISNSITGCPSPYTNYAPDACVDCAEGYFGGACALSNSTCNQHGSLVGATSVTAVCVCTGNYTGDECQTSPYSSTPPATVLNASLPTSAIIGIAVGASLVLLALVGIVALVAVRTRRQRKVEKLYIEGIIASNDASIAFTSLINWTYLSHGEYGDVSRATWVEHGTTVAVKKVRANDVTKDQRSELVQEGIKMKALGGVANINIVQYYGMSVDAALNVYLVLEYCEGGSLLGCLQDPRADWLLRPADLRLIALNVATGLEFLAKHSIVHRDVAARNVFLYKKGSVIHGKLGDLGMALTVTVASGTRRIADSGKVPIRWCAPEVLTVGEYSTMSDVWAFGIMYWEAMSGGQRPYDDVAQSDEVAQRIRNGSILKQPARCADEDYNLMVSCWAKAPTGRPDFSTIKTILQAMVDSGPAGTEPPSSTSASPPAYGEPLQAEGYQGIPMKVVRQDV